MKNKYLQTYTKTIFYELFLMPVNILTLAEASLKLNSFENMKNQM